MDDGDAKMEATVKTEKKALRREMRSKRGALGPEKRNELSDIIQNNIMALPLWQNASRVVLYVAMGDEAATDRLLQNAWDSGKTALVPKVTDKKAGIMQFVACKGRDDLREGAYGILEPRYEEGKTPLETSPPDMILIPGLAFDKRGYRLGYGGGYYDRFLAAHPDWIAPRIAVAFSMQLVEHVPTDRYDCPLNAVCTEDGLLWF